MAIKNILERGRTGKEKISTLRRNVFVGVHILEGKAGESRDAMVQSLISSKSLKTAREEIERFGKKHPGAVVIMPKTTLYSGLGEFAKKHGLKVEHLPELPQKIYEKKKDAAKILSIGKLDESTEAEKIMKRLYGDPEFGVKFGEALKGMQDNKVKLAEAAVENSLLKTMMKQKEPHMIIANAQHLHNLSRTPRIKKVFSRYRNATNKLISPFLKKEGYAGFGDKIAAARRRILSK